MLKERLLRRGGAGIEHSQLQAFLVDPAKRLGDDVAGSKNGSDISFQPVLSLFYRIVRETVGVDRHVDGKRRHRSVFVNEFGLFGRPSFAGISRPFGGFASDWIRGN